MWPTPHTHTLPRARLHRADMRGSSMRACKQPCQKFLLYSPCWPPGCRHCQHKWNSRGPCVTCCAGQTGTAMVSTQMARLGCNHAWPCLLLTGPCTLSPVRWVSRPLVCTALLAWEKGLSVGDYGAQCLDSSTCRISGRALGPATQKENPSPATAACHSCMPQL